MAPQNNTFVLAGDLPPLLSRRDLERWHATPPHGHPFRALQIDPGSAAEPVLRELIELGTRVVLFAGLVCPEAVLGARLLGLRVILALRREDLAGARLGDWRDPRVAAPFHAHLVLGLGVDRPLRVATDENHAWTTSYIAGDLASVDLHHVLMLADKILDTTSQPPWGVSTFWQVCAELELWRTIASGDIEAEALTVQERNWQRCFRMPGAEFKSTRTRPTLANPGRKPRVLFVSHELSKTGAPTAMLWALRGMRELGTSFEPWVLGIGDGPMEELFVEEVGVERFRKAHFQDDFPHYGEILAAYDAIDPEIVFLNASPVYAHAPLLRWKGIPVVWWFHDGINVAKRDGHLFSQSALEAFHRYALHSSDRVLTASHDTVRQIELFCPPIEGRVGMVPYGFDVDAILREGERLRAERAELRAEFEIPDDGVLFACVGSLERRKNQKRLVEAFQNLLRSLPEAERGKHHLALVGRLDPDNLGPKSFHSEILAAIEPEFAAQVHITGPRPSGFPIMVAADCQVLVSTNECSPLVNIESMLLETFVISSRVHGIPEVVLDGVRGKLVEPEDVADIESALRWLVETRARKPQELDAIKARAKAYAIANHGFVNTGSIVREELQRMLELRKGPSTRLVGEVANRGLEGELMLRWSLVKHDAWHACLLTRERCHTFHNSDATFPTPTQSAATRGA
ncbi:MAG: glycosyltransferase family 4 protein [Planctomycetes bacterium]|nr:glycosyltransferase family 4 protein [Planctomycetota bacterium]